ncbi:hypothetical protein M8J77_026537 [Diaphorina citri]|nr:hypothetical protein M8J77_026537 [Diaphorina citri]
MYENSCSYQTALDLKHRVTGPVGVTSIKSEMPEYILGDASPPMDWATGCTYRFTCNTSTFEQLKQSVEKAKAALQDTRNYSSAFSDLSSSTNYCTSTPTPPIPVTSSNSTNSSSLRLSNGQSHHQSSPNESDEPASNSDTKRNFNDSSSSKSSEKNSICANYTPSSVANSLSTSKSSYHQLTSSISDSLKFKTVVQRKLPYSFKCKLTGLKFWPSNWTGMLLNASGKDVLYDGYLKTTDYKSEGYVFKFQVTEA